VLKLGTPYSEPLAKLSSVRREIAVFVRGFADMGEAEVASLCGLSLEQARLSKLREFDEPVVISPGTPENVEAVRRALDRRGLRLIRGDRFFQVTGSADKGTAMIRLLRLFRTEWLKVITVGIGDSENDLEMLRHVETAFVVQGPDGTLNPELMTIRGAIPIAAVVPAGWARAAASLLRQGLPQSTG
jgi:mannosyl-3-phosphoglycerate phosphatase